MNLEPALRSRLTNVARLALHSATPEKEWQAAAIAFFRSLRTAKIPAELLVNGETGNIKNPVPPTSPDYKGGPKPYFFPYGKYKNVPISQVDEGYLVWALANIKKLSPRFRAAIEKELFERAN